MFRSKSGMMRKIRMKSCCALVLVLAIPAVGLFGCEKKSESTTTTKTEEVTKEATPTQGAEAQAESPTTGDASAQSQSKPTSTPLEYDIEAKLKALRSTIAIPKRETPSPHQIQLGVDDKIAGTIIGEKPNLDLTFTNQDGKEVNLAQSYPGKVLVISTIYTSCPLPDMCPRLTADFANLAGEMPDELKDYVQFILVSFDPQRDTPEVLKAFGQQRGIDFEHTDLLRGDIDQTQKLMEDSLQIPLEVNPETNMIVTHAMMLDIINRDGYIVVERTVSTSKPMEDVKDETVRAVLLPFDPAKVPGANSTDSDG